MRTRDSEQANAARLVWLGGVVGVVLVFDTVAAIVSALTGISYMTFTIGSLLIYFGVGFLVGKRFGFRSGAAAGIVAGLADSTLGWAVAWVIGPAQVDRSPLSAAELLGTIAVVTAGSTFVAAIGLYFGSRSSGSVLREGRAS